MPADGAELTFALDHVGIDMDDLPAQIDFYRRAFDLKVELQGDVPEDNFSAAMLVSPTGWHLEVFKRDRVAPRPVPDDPDGQHNALGLSHVCFDVDDLVSVLDRLLFLVAVILLPRSHSPGSRNGGWRTSQTPRATSSS